MDFRSMPSAPVGTALVVYGAACFGAGSIVGVLVFWGVSWLGS